jgi:hypothetical protein
MAGTIWGKGVGRERTKVGKFLDANGISHGDIQKWSGVSAPTITSLCGDISYKPSSLTKRSIIAALQKREYDVEEYSFW